MAYDLGTARGVIELEYNGRGVREAEKDIAGLEGSSKRAGMSADEVGKHAGRAGLVIAAGMGAGVAAAASFEQRMSAISAVSGATGGELDKLRDKALQLGKDTAFSAGESASAMEELVKAGLSVDDVLNGAADATVALAAAGEVNMVEAATVASNAMNQFNLKAEDMVNIADKIAGAANASAIDVSDLGQAMQQAGAVANLAGLSFDDTATAIGLMGNAGIRGSDAGTSLKSMLMRLQPTTKQAYEEMNRLGLIGMDTNKAMEVLRDNGIKGVTEANADQKMQELAASLAGAEVGSAKAANKMLELGLQTGFLRNQFYKANGETKSLAGISDTLAKSMQGLDKRQQQAALTTLFGSDAIRGAAILAKNGAKGVNEFADSMGKVTAADVAATRMDNFKGSLEEMKGSLETMGIAIGTIMLPPLRELVDQITAAFNWFLNLDEGTQKVIIGFIAAVGASLLMVSAVIKIVKFMQAARAAFIAVRTAAAIMWATTLGPIALVIAAIAAVVAIIVLLWKKNDAFREAVIKAWEAIKGAFWAVVNWIQTNILPPILAVWDGIVSAVKTAINIVKAIITTIMKVIVGIWKAYWKMFGPLVKAIWRLITSVIKLGWTIIKGLFILYFRLIKAIFTTMWNAMVAILKAVWKTIKAVIKTSMDSIKFIWDKIWGLIGDKVKAVWNGIINGIKGHISDFMNGFHELKDKIFGFFSKAGSWLYDKGKAIIQGLIDGISSMINAVSDKIESVTGVIGKFLPGSPVKEGPLKVINRGHAGKQIVEMILDGMEGAVRVVGRSGDLMGAGLLEAAIPTSVPANLRGSVTAPSSAQVVNHWNIPIHNPEPERSTVSVGRALQSRVEEKGWTR